MPKRKQSTTRKRPKPAKKPASAPSSKPTSLPEYNSTSTGKTNTVLRETEERDTILQNSPEAIIIHTEGKIVSVNRFAIELIGAHSASQLIGKPLLSLIHPDYHQTAKLHFDTMLKKRQTVPVVEEKFIRLDNKVIDVEVASFPAVYAEKPAIQVVVRNISDRKKTEADLRDAVHYNEQIVSTAGQGIVVYDTELRHVVWNAFLEKLTGMTAKEVIGKRAIDVFPNLREQGVYELLLRTIAGETTKADDVFFYLPKTGKSFWVMGNYVPHRNTKGKIIGVIGVISDISEQKRIEAAIRQSDERYRAFIAQSTEGIYRFEFRKPMPINLPENEQLEYISKHGFISECNLAMAQMYGYTSSAELIGKYSAELLPLTDPQNEYFMRSFIRSQYRLVDAESHEVDKSGKTKFFLNNKMGIVEHGMLMHVWGTQRDITERKLAEEAFRLSESKYRQLIEQMNDGLMQVTTDNVILFVNRQLCEMVGYTQKELLGKIATNVITDEEGRRTVLEKLKLRQRGLSDQYEIQLIKKSGERIWVRINGTPVYDRNGTVVGSIGLHTNITAQKRAAEALRESEHKFRGLFENVPDGVYQSTPEGKLLAANPALVRMLGYDSEEELRSVTSIVELYVNPTQREYFLQKLNTVGEIRNAEIILRRKNGEIITVLENSRCLRNDSGEILYYEGTLTDITDRKRSERALQESEERFRKIFEESPTGIALVNSAMRIVNVNEAFCTMLGYSKQEMTDKKLKDITHQDDFKLDTELIEKIFLGELPSFRVQKRYCTKTNDVIWSNATASLIRDEHGKPLYCMQVIENITDQKAAELAVKESERKYRSLIEQSNDAIYLLYDGKFDLVNKKFMQLFGITADDVRSPNFNFIDLVAPESVPLIQERQELIRTGKEPPLRYEFIARTSEGKPIHLEASVSYIDYKGGKAVQGILRDVTERKHAEEGLKQTLSLLQSTLESTADGILLVDIHGKIVTFNRRFAQMWRIPEEVLARGDDTALAEGLAQLVDPNAFIAKKIELDSKPEAESFDTITFKDGRVFERYSLPQRAEGKPVGRVWSFRDITQRLQAELALRDSEEKYRTLFEESKDAVFITSIEGKFIDINPAGVELFGYASKEELMQVNIADEIYFNQNDRKTFQKIVEQNGFVRDFDLTLRRKDGEKIVVQETATAVRDANGTLVAFRGIIRDITDRKRLEEQLRQAQKLQSIGTLAGGIAHDFNNILGIVLGYISRLSRNKTNIERIDQSISAITKATERGTGLVRQLLMFARQTDVTLESVDVNAVVEEIGKIVNETFPKTVRLSVELTQPLPTIVADSNQLHQALLNLCLNAKDAMEQGGQLLLATQIMDGERLRQRIPKAFEESYVCISVSDTGSGMDDATLNRIFEPFFTTKRRGAGTGLGLAVVYGIVDSHRGFIDVYSELGRGTTFRIYLPNPQGDMAAGKRKVELSAHLPGGTETLLVVEDEDMLLDLLRSTLEAKGYRILSAHDGEEAVQIYREHVQEIALVITDLGLPKLGGLEATIEMMSVNPKMKVIFASGYLDPNIKTELAKARAKAFIQKPYDTDEVIRYVRNVLDAAV